LFGNPISDASLSEVRSKDRECGNVATAVAASVVPARCLSIRLPAAETAKKEQSGCSMNTGVVLTNVALLLIVAAFWDDMKRGGRLEPRRRTWLLTASIFAITGIVTALLR
jgi:hypothetical protein